MTTWIGTDEAGFGPNLGPLVIGAAAWHIPAAQHAPVAPGDLDFYERLADWVGRSPGQRPITIADSKQLYHSGAGLAALENAVLPCLLCLDVAPRTWRQIWVALVPHLADDVMASPWHCDYDEPLPIDASSDSVRTGFDRLRDGLAATCVRLAAIEADAVFPREFNQLVDQFGSKGAVLSHRTLRLAERLWRTCDDSRTVVQCDKHGGRNGYVPVLQTIFPDYLVEVVCESRPVSIYGWGPPERRIEFRFSAKGESFLPTALASLVAKYLRELAMRAFNAFWQAQTPGLRPTAGYPVDARRFLLDIAAAAQARDIDQDLFWRCR